MSILFHHIPRTGGTFLRGVLANEHGLDIDLCYSDEDIRNCINKLMFGHPARMIIFGHRTKDLAGVVKAFRPEFLEVAFFRDPNEITQSEFDYIRRNSEHHLQAEALDSPDALTFSRDHLKPNPILTHLGDRRPERWFSFYDIKGGYRQICRLIGIDPKKEVLESIRQATASLPQMEALNWRDYEFLQKINIALPKK